ncbi:MAG: imidazole glycerol phosphate synthase subunit HisH [Lachnospiraceae bacterium]|nr:imidazole glycerol phosphate synthase subunit HisH [Lachnospiraceae bacterium]
MVVIIDYDAGNVMSVLRACEAVGAEAVISGDYDVMAKASHVILPGQGAFGDAMDHIKSRQLFEPIRDVVKKGVPFLGICLGLQVLFSGSDESEGTQGLDLLPGRIKRIPNGTDSMGNRLHIPHIGWNTVRLSGDGRLFKGIAKEPFFYFDHSYYLDCDDKSIVRGTCEYGVCMDVTVERDNIFACQFHPEKSSDTGLRILENFVRL